MSQVQIEESSFGKLPDGQEVRRFSIKNKNDFTVSVISYGAAVQSISLKDKTSKLTNVALGFDKIEEYSDFGLNPYFGATIGRVTNRISNGEFKINGEAYKLDKNNGNHCLHSGAHGVSRKNWTGTVIDNGVKFTYISPDGEAGFPGELWIEVSYLVDPDENRLTIEYRAITDKATPEKIYDHEVQFFSDSYLDFNPQEITVTGKINQVENTKYDFRTPIKLSDRIKSGGSWPEEGYDNYFVALLNKSNIKPLALVKNPSNGIKLEVSSNQNGFQFYTGNYLNLKKPSNGQTYSIHDGFAIESHNYPDSVNIASFPSIILNPDEEYYQMTTCTFTVDN